MVLEGAGTCTFKGWGWKLDSGFFFFNVLFYLLGEIFVVTKGDVKI